MKRVFLLIAIFSFINCTSESEGRDSTKVKTNSEHFEYISSVKLPKSLSWCGEEVPLEIEEVRERAEREFYLLLQQPGQLMLYIKRSGRYFPVFEKIIKEHGMPDDLKYLSVAESALYMSRSSKDAVGLWQFIPATARSMGLVVNDLIDERRNVEKSTNAAMKYLKQGYQAQKSWMMAAAGYNMGHTNLNYGVKLQQSDYYFDLFLNDETSRYIFRIVIIKELMKNAEKYGLIVEEDEKYKPYSSKKVIVDSGLDNIADWAGRQGTTYKYVKLYNPWILKGELPNPGKNNIWVVEIPE